MPREVYESFSMEGFTVSITGRDGHSVAVDEAHEMLINKDCKQAVIRPARELIDRLALYFPFRSKVTNNLKQQLSRRDSLVHNCETSEKSRNLKMKDNIEALQRGIYNSDLLPLEPCPDTKLRNGFSGVTATSLDKTTSITT